MTEFRTDASGPYEVVWLDNGVLRLGIVPALGGRLLALVHEGEELLWRNPALLDDRLHPAGGHRPARTSGPMANWRNYGGDKTWPAPQGWSSDAEWAGPPDPVRDSGPYGADVRTGPGFAAVTLTSEHDPRTGLRLRREIRLAAGAAYDLRPVRQPGAAMIDAAADMLGGFIDDPSSASREVTIGAELVLRGSTG